ncbi:hypothetical protein X805_21550 [Sphaerotilus natans subsp. natans DSM 6575]|uniref:Uncharacterized protein n=1 Tax=Sphaerotilus natans subsp. natans DSM 6575 TaxID=1286631 RepID=A0A059KL85_9BURK|nr:hypothetical protein X805_21550 [Sphaerotilus natans subsp. natans DSM 6575]
MHLRHSPKPPSCPQTSVMPANLRHARKPPSCPRRRAPTRGRRLRCAWVLAFARMTMTGGKLQESTGELL